MVKDDVLKSKYPEYDSKHLCSYLECSMHYYELKVLGFNRFIDLFYPNVSIEDCLNLVSNEKEHFSDVLKELIQRGEDVSEFPKELNYLERLN